MIPEQAEVLPVERWRRLSLEERFRIVAAMIEDGFALVAASIGRRIPNARGIPGRPPNANLC